MVMPTVRLTLEQTAELLHTLPKMPEQFANALHPHSNCVHNLDYVCRSSVDNLQARYDVTGDGKLQITLMMQGGRHVWTVTLPSE